ncbi:putative serine/threonine-protein kinase PLK4 [Apostichopus japonicus]|uniref:Putative serine/threonine-protein kinase PLK4 n=1 Tax=Stichopus japonicus TaxID=307972 RepID=A0A2G8KNY1_STIJA|nr:putative serine/threonine-protein kinase PLK4 [Apostichopus japonicus]
MLSGISKAKLLSTEGVSTGGTRRADRGVPGGSVLSGSISSGLGGSGTDKNGSQTEGSVLAGKQNSQQNGPIIMEPPTVQRFGSHTHSTTGTSTGEEGSRNQEPMQKRNARKQNRREEGSERSETGAKRLTDLTPPLNASRLRPIRQQTRNAVVSILVGGEVCVEFLKRKDGCDRVVEVQRISQDGMKVMTYLPNNGKGFPVSDRPPSPPPEETVSHSYHNLPSKYWKKYQYAAKFVHLVRSKTPKITLYSDQAKCMVMENGPHPDLEACFYNGGRVHVSSSGVVVTDAEGSTHNQPTLEDKPNLPGSLQVLLEHIQDLYQKCLEVESTVASLESRVGHGPYFPIILNRKPTQEELEHKSGETRMSTNKSRHHLESPPKALSQVKQQIPLGSTTSPSVAPLVSASVCSYDGTVVSTKSGVPSRVADRIPISSNCGEDFKSANQHDRDEVLKRLYVHNVGWASQMVSGEIRIQYNDGSELAVKSSVALVTYHDTEGNVNIYGKQDRLPLTVREKLSQLSTIVEMFVSKASPPD